MFERMGWEKYTGYLVYGKVIYILDDKEYAKDRYVILSIR